MYLLMLVHLCSILCSHTYIYWFRYLSIHIKYISDAPGDVLAAKYCADENKFGDDVAVSCIAVATGECAYIIYMHMYILTYTHIYTYICIHTNLSLYMFMNLDIIDDCLPI
jgi:hypothetical protein